MEKVVAEVATFGMSEPWDLIKTSISRMAISEFDLRKPAHCNTDFRHIFRDFATNDELKERLLPYVCRDLCRERKIYFTNALQYRRNQKKQ